MANKVFIIKGDVFWTKWVFDEKGKPISHSIIDPNSIKDDEKPQEQSNRGNGAGFSPKDN
jgi:hypothetical protein